MKVGTIYKCKWKYENEVECGWELLLFLKEVPLSFPSETHYHFYDILAGERRVIADDLVLNCKEIILEET